MFVTKLVILIKEIVMLLSNAAYTVFGYNRDQLRNRNSEKGHFTYEPT